MNNLKPRDTTTLFRSLKSRKENATTWDHFKAVVSNYFFLIDDPASLCENSDENKVLRQERIESNTHTMSKANDQAVQGSDHRNNAHQEGNNTTQSLETNDITTNVAQSTECAIVCTNNSDKSITISKGYLAQKIEDNLTIIARAQSSRIPLTIAYNQNGKTYEIAGNESIIQHINSHNQSLIINLTSENLRLQKLIDDHDLNTTSKKITAFLACCGAIVLSVAILPLVLMAVIPNQIFVSIREVAFQKKEEQESDIDLNNYD
jgi:hypothetical protein